MWAKTVGATIVIGGVLGGGCLGAPGVTPQPPAGAQAGPEPASAAPIPTEKPAPESPNTPSGPPPAASAPRQAIATPNAANGQIGLVIADSLAACGPLTSFPSTCEPAWRIRIDLQAEHQRPGRYALGPELSPFSYRDAQGPSGGAWGKGSDCKNLGGHIVGSLQILAIDEQGISGVLSGAGEADGPFRAQRCPSCLGTGNACSSNRECCNDFCYSGRCQP